PPEDILTRHAHVREPHDLILDRLEPHEAAAMHDLHARRVRLDDERSDLLAWLSVHDGVRRARHDDEQVSARAVRAPELLAVQRPELPVLAPRRARAEIGGIGAGVDLSEGKGRNGSLGEPREVALLLLRRPEQLQWLRQADG